jgi:hypothetical protein
LEKELARVVSMLDVDTFEYKLINALLDKMQLRLILIEESRKDTKQKVIL